MERFVQFIVLYRRTANSANNLLKRYLKIENPMFWKQSGAPKAGWIGSNMEYEYTFHGTDCTFNFGDSQIEFEFGYDGRVGGFNGWKLFCFAEDGTGDYPEFQDDNYINKCIEKAKKNRIISTPFIEKSDDLYYLVVLNGGCRA